MAYTHKFREAKPKYVDIGDSFYVHKIGRDTNGNKSIWVAKGNNKPIKIQTNGNLPITHKNAMTNLSWFDADDRKPVKDSIDEIISYMKDKK